MCGIAETGKARFEVDGVSGRRVLAVIPARGGSKGLPRKNLVTIAGRHLIEHSIEQAQATAMINEVVVSTDDPEIAEVGLNETAIGLALPQPALELARDRIAPTELTNAVILANLYAPDDAVRFGYLDKAVTAEAFDATVMATAKALGELDRTAFMTTKRRLRQATVDRISAAA